jgi:hypothetical protein
MSDIPDEFPPFNPIFKDPHIDREYWKRVEEVIDPKETTKEKKMPPQKPKAMDKIKQAWNENPVGVAVVVGGLITAAAKFIDAVGGYRSKKAYSRRYGSKRK